MLVEFVYDFTPPPRIGLSKWPAVLRELDARPGIWAKMDSRPDAIKALGVVHYLRETYGRQGYEFAHLDNIVYGRRVEA